MTWPFAISSALLSLAFWGQAHAVPEADFAKAWPTQIAPFFSSVPSESIGGEGGVTLSFRRFVHPKAKGVVVIAPGYSEFYDKYAETTYDLYQIGYSVVIFDHRGQGHSGRLLKDPKLAHVDDFENFVRDLKTLRDKVVEPLNPGLPRFLLAHSMGGLIAARYLEEHPQDFSAAVLSAPMLRINLSPWMEILATTLMGLASSVGLDDLCVRGPVDPTSYKFATNEVSHSEIRYNSLQLAGTQKWPEAQVWGLTAGWLYRSIRAAAAARLAAQNTKTPLLILAADQDAFVSNRDEDEFCKVAPHCQLVRFPDSKHEVLMEADRVREPALKQTLDFLAQFH